MARNLSAKYHQQNKESLQQKSHERYQNLCKRNKKQQYCRKRYKDLSEDENNKLVEYKKRYYRMEKKTFVLNNNDLES